MYRELMTAAAIGAGVAAAALSAAPFAAADGAGQGQGPYTGDVPGITYGARLDAPCFQWERFIYGRGMDGEPLACHYIPGQSPIGMDRPPQGTGFWVATYKLYGVQVPGSPCPGSQASAQSPDGLPMLCLGAQGWQAGQMSPGDWGNGAFFIPAGG
jgi:hypothetical protein